MNNIKKISKIFLPVFISVITINAVSAQGQKRPFDKMREERSNNSSANTSQPRPQASPFRDRVEQMNRSQSNPAYNRPPVQQNPPVAQRRRPFDQMNNTVATNRPPVQLNSSSQSRKPFDQINTVRAAQIANRGTGSYNNNGYASNYHTGYRNGYARPYHYYYSGAYHYYPSYYRPFNSPSYGLRINVLPRGYYRVNYHNSRYYYYGGNFYRPYGGYYETILPPLGAYITILPSGAYPVYINDLNYYEYSGTYYQPYSNGYRIAGVNGYLESDIPAATDNNDIISDDSLPGGSSTGAPLTVLPGDFKTVTLNNIVYYVSPSGEYFTKNIDEKGTVTYRVAAVESSGK